LVIAGPLPEDWSRLEAIPLFEEPFVLGVSAGHRLANRDEVEFGELSSETLLINDGCELVDKIKVCLQSNGILDTATHRVATQEDLLILLRTGLGVAIIPVGAAEADGVRRVELKQLNLVRCVSVYSVAGRNRTVACATLFNMLRAAEWA
jgi:DNA-binding transcriptional LysR family regulator